MEFLGANISSGEGQNNFWNKKLENFKFIMQRLSIISKHDAMILILHAAYLPRLTFFPRTSPNPDESILKCFDQYLRDGFQTVFNVSLNQKVWQQAILPISVGDLGLGSVAEPAHSAFLASAAATATLQELLLFSDKSYPDNIRTQVYDKWRAVYGNVFGYETQFQKVWNASAISKSYENLLKLNCSAYDKARMMALKTSIPVIKKSVGLVEEGSFRPDGYTISPWAMGRSLVWDVTFPHTMADSHHHVIFTRVVLPKNGIYFDNLGTLTYNSWVAIYVDVLTIHAKLQKIGTY
ncbi:hypothetical protein HELRODRAFT_180123 [Helobdella robusta]|uniref:Uncharacterized protein n=1 Tax=Helobdella robusta TaxID=6412 RepID=T1FFH7_HELRO|nr:hypothetical protein HELRODRAFT_180123 [Helobdella robusta]ESN94783.1 hypothetical protein HELRODRAFT_180123 [Helobdella robusta]